MSLDGSESLAPALSPSSSCGDFAALLDAELFVHEQSMADRPEDEGLVIYGNMSSSPHRFSI
uniref:Uncharacterized protein n=1 Tax=Physcomitrium patens TaxID=3218 RepID=A0A2K1J040_PHYPA|nr:hypothetical protein PHYPA_022789 [Physcomitrium patens]